jgi:hypothetical protein
VDLYRRQPAVLADPGASVRLRHIGQPPAYQFEDESWIMSIVIGGIMLSIPIIK